MAGVPRTLDGPRRQTLVDLWDDEAEYRWHHRLLLLSTDIPGRRTWATPDFEVAAANLIARRIIFLQRNEEFPADYRGFFYAFGQRGATDRRVEMMRQRARALAEIMSGGSIAPAVADGATWHVADTAHAPLGLEIPAAMLNLGEHFIARGKVAPVTFEPNDDGKHAAYGFLRAPKLSELGVVAHHNDCVAEPGLSLSANVTQAYRRIGEALTLMTQWDQRDLCNSAAAESPLRFLITIESAARRDPRALDFSLYDEITGGTLGEVGAFSLPGFVLCLADAQHDKAPVMKQCLSWSKHVMHGPYSASSTGGGGVGSGSSALGDAEGGGGGEGGGAGGIGGAPAAEP